MEPAEWLLPLSAFCGGIVLGLAARLGRFCTLSAFEDAIFGAGTLRLRMWGLAIAVAALAMFVLEAAGRFDSAETFYLSTPVPLISTILGGLVFGLGMALVGTCGYGALARLGGGDLSGLVVFLVLGMTGYIASNGFIAEWRVALLPAQETTAESAGIAHWLAARIALPVWSVGALIAAMFGGLCLVGGTLRESPSRMGWAVGAGLAIAGGWAATVWAHGASFGEVAIRSFSFVRPLGDTMFYLMTSSAGGGIGFSTASVGGVIVGAVFGALWRREFRWEACDDAPTLKRQILGAAMMGVGGVFAMGCTVGQGLSAASVLAVSAPVALLSMFAGAWLGLQWLVRGSVVSPLREMIAGE